MAKFLGLLVLSGLMICFKSEAASNSTSLPSTSQTTMPAPSSSTYGNNSKAPKYAYLPSTSQTKPPASPSSSNGSANEGNSQSLPIQSPAQNGSTPLSTNTTSQDRIMNTSTKSISPHPASTVVTQSKSTALSPCTTPHQHSATLSASAGSQRTNMTDRVTPKTTRLSSTSGTGKITLHHPITESKESQGSLSSATQLSTTLKAVGTDKSTTIAPSTNKLQITTILSTSTCQDKGATNQSSPIQTHQPTGTKSASKPPPPSNTSQQHSTPLSTNTSQGKSPLNISDSAPTTSIMSTLSPTPIPATTVVPEKCSFSITETMDTFEVNINGSATSNYKLQFTSIKKQTMNESQSLEEVLSVERTTFQIPFKRLKPCQKYEIFVKTSKNVTCKGNGIFDTKTWDEKGLESSWNSSSVCFRTSKWNLTKCISIDQNKVCMEQRFDFGVCNKSIKITIPPVKPNIIYYNQIPTILTWQNLPTHCQGERSFTCRNTGNNETVNPSDFRPYVKYNCIGKYKVDNIIKSVESNISVNITCDLDPELKLSTTSTTLTASWNSKTTNCGMLNLTVKIDCKPPKILEGNSCETTNKRECTVKELKPFVNYACSLTAKYNNMHPVAQVSQTISTKAGTPLIELEKSLKINNISHNSFQVPCPEMKAWSGTPGYYVACLYQGSNFQKNITRKSNDKNCYFTVDHLSYSTTYTLKVLIKNQEGHESEIRIVRLETKYNDKAVLGFLVFLIIFTSLALLFVLYKIFLLKKKHSRNDNEMDELLPEDKLLTVEPIATEGLVEAYKRKIADEGRLFMDEFQSIPRIFSNYTVKEAKKQENQSKNRYVDILPYDHNRVQLTHGEGSGYINASFIEGYKEPNKYIAAQGPKEETIEDFWRMIWEQKTSIIVMVTRCEEGNRNKCAQYWPSLERETEIFDDFVVKIKAEENSPDYVIRHLTLMNRKEKTPERDVTHIQFMSWPDHGVPDDPGLLLKLRRRVNSFKNIFSGPIVTHCSAGVGRTGTYICIDAMIESIEAEGRVDIYGYVVKLRRQRCLMVQVEAQYVLIHQALIEYNQFGETEISLPDLHPSLNTLRQKEGSEASLMEIEFQKLPKYKNWRTCKVAHTEENEKKNRDTAVVPYDFNRVLIKVNDDTSHHSDGEDDEDYSSEEDEEDSIYINASYVDGYWCPASLIAAQGPLPDTVEDFLQMLLQKQVKTVVALSDCKENNKEFCSQYWHDEKKTFGHMMVEVQETERFPTYIRRCLAIQNTKLPQKNNIHTVQQYHFLKWVEGEIPENPHDLIDMMRIIRKNGRYDNGRESRSVPVVVHCNDGSSRSGIFCALWKILDSADTEKLVDVFQMAKSMRKARPGMFTTYEQYKYLYASIEVAFPVQNGEVKKEAASSDLVEVINEQVTPFSTTGGDQEEAAKSQVPVVQADEATADNPTASTSPTSTENGASESTELAEKSPSEETANGPTVTVEV